MNAIIITALVLLPGELLAQGLPLVDTHSHFQSMPVKELAASQRTALAIMDRFQIARSLLMPPPFDAAAAPRAVYDVEDLMFAVKANPDRFAALGGSSLNIMIHGTPAEAVDETIRARFRKRAAEIVAAGAVGFGEIAALHVSIPAMGPRHAFEMVSPDHPLLLLLADIGAESGLPIDLHCDLVPEDMPLPEPLRSNASNPAQLKSNIGALHRLLSHNAKAQFVWSHVGFEPLLTREPALVRLMLREHPNLMMSFRLNRGAPRPAAALTPTGKLKPGWVQLVAEFPERFMLGSDAFYSAEGIARGSGEEGLANLRALIEQLPAPAAAKVASENAVRIYRLGPAR
jgi:hypothetical protein